MADKAWLRITLLWLAPIVTLLLSQDTVLVAFTCASSLVAAAFDIFRQRRRCLPFPIYLLLIYASQLFSLVAYPDTASTNGNPALPLESFAFETFRHGTIGDGHALSHEAVAAPHPIETMSVVIAAHNEHAYMKRTLDSIYGNTPASVLKEIIVVDDASSPPLAKKLEEFPEVKVIRHEQRRGLIKSKTEGGNMATSDMIMFLDGHVKPEKDWWKPLLKHMNFNYKRVVVPVIPVLNPETWQPNLNAIGTKMMFDWTLFFQWFEDYNDLVPCMSGGLFGITRQWWHESGEYDYGMSMWGGENIEQSIRVWLCGGEIYVARDSRISHVFRSTFPYKINNTEIYLNKVRTVEVWFDEFKENYYKADPGARQFVKFIGNISDRFALKKKLQCKPFKWYIEKFHKVFAEKHMLPEEVFMFRDTETGQCVQISTGQDQGTHHHDDEEDSSDDEDSLMEAACDINNQQQLWSVGPGGSGFRNRGANKCLDANAAQREKEGMRVFLYHCSKQNDMQSWKLQRGNVQWHGYCLQWSGKGDMKLTKCDKFLQKTGTFEFYGNHSVTGPGQL